MPIDKNLMGVGQENVVGAQDYQDNHIWMFAKSRYINFYQRYLRTRLLLAKGYIRGFHDIKGVVPSYLCQKLSAGITNILFSNPLIFNTPDKKTRSFLNDKRFLDAKLQEVIRKAYTFAIEGGTSLLKINGNSWGDLYFDCVPMDCFYCDFDNQNKIISCQSFLNGYVSTLSTNDEYRVCETRYFVKRQIDGYMYRQPVTMLQLYRVSATLEAGEQPTILTKDEFLRLPTEFLKQIEFDYSLHSFYKEKILPFKDHLGCELIKFTDSIPQYPSLPFGQPLADLVLNEIFQYDQLKYFERLEVFATRARVMLPEGLINPEDPQNASAILDDFVIEFYDDVMGDNKDGKPILIAPPMRAGDIRQQKQNIMNDIAFGLNLSSTTVASWLSDGSAQRTATEIDYERAKTDNFLKSKASLLRFPLQNLLDLFFNYYGLEAPKIDFNTTNSATRLEKLNVYAQLFTQGLLPANMFAEELSETKDSGEIEMLTQHIEQAQQQMQQAQQQQGMQDGADDDDIANYMSQEQVQEAQDGYANRMGGDF